MLAATYLAAALVVALSVLTGRAILAACGRRDWVGIEPAVGFAALMTVQGLLAQFPANREGLLLGLVALFLASLYLLRRTGGWRLPGSPWFWAAVAAAVLLTAVPFIVSGRWGLLGMGYNNDLGLHLAWAESLRSGFGTEPFAGYPLGPHGLAASLSFLPGISLGTSFIGIIVAIPVLTVMTAWYALERLVPRRRLAAAVLVTFTYLMASFFAQAAFKEVMAAMFLLAFTIALPEILPRPATHRERPRLIAPVIVLLAGIVFTYSFPGLAFPVAVTLAWALSDREFRSKVSQGSVFAFLRRPVVAVGLSAVVLLLLALFLFGPFGGFISTFTKVATGEAFGRVSAVEAFGVWLNPDYRLDSDSSTPLPGLMGAIGVAAVLLALWWWYRQPRSVYPFALLACIAFYLLSLPWVGDYSLAKALVISSPIVMVVILTALFSAPPDLRAGAGTGSGRARRAVWIGWRSFGLVFVVLAFSSSLLALRDASVSPPGKAEQLAAFRDQVEGKSVLYGDQDRFASYYLTGVDVSLPHPFFPDPDITANQNKPFKGKFGQSAIDFDSFDAETLNNHDYVITTAAAWTSKPPPFFELVDQTNDFKLWRRTGTAFDRSILKENAFPARLIDCSREEDLDFSQLDGEAVLMPETVLGPVGDWSPSFRIRPGESVSQSLDLTPGRWRISLQYFTPGGMTLSAPGLRVEFDPAIDGQRMSNKSTKSFGQVWPGGLIEVEVAGPVEFTVETSEPSAIQRITRYSRETSLGRIALTRTGPRERTSMSETCGRWVDFFRHSNPDDAQDAPARDGAAVDSGAGSRSSDPTGKVPTGPGGAGAANSGSG